MITIQHGRYKYRAKSGVESGKFTDQLPCGTQFNTPPTPLYYTTQSSRQIIMSNNNATDRSLTLYWSKLPDELFSKILRFTVAEDKTTNVEPSMSVIERLRKYLKPWVAGRIIEFFYKANTFRLSVFNRGGTTTFLLPNRKQGSHIQKLAIRMTFELSSIIRIRKFRVVNFKLSGV
jgi:hypothetical protein